MSRYRHKDDYSPSDLKERSPTLAGKETIDEFLRRGGKIQRIPSGLSSYEWRGPAYNRVKK